MPISSIVPHRACAITRIEFRLLIRASSINGVCHWACQHGLAPQAYGVHERRRNELASDERAARLEGTPPDVALRTPGSHEAMVTHPPVESGRRPFEPTSHCARAAQSLASIALIDRGSAMSGVVIVSAARTAVGKFGGSLAGLPASELGALAIRAALERAQVDPASVDEVIMGQVLAAGCGQNPARQAAMRAGLPEHVPALTINKVCGSGLKAVALAANAIRAGDADVVVAGGQENMSASPHVLPGSRDGWRMGDVQAVDTMIRDGLWDAFNGYHMGTTAENVARQHGVGREQQDAFAVASQNRAEAAQKAGRFQEEIVPVMVPQRKGAPVAFATDEFVRHGVTLDAVAGLKPAFAKDGSVTAGNASGLNDGAAALVVMSGARAAALGLEPLARIRAHASAGLDPAYMGLGPVPASRRCLERAGWGVDDLDLMEINEAFAAQACAVNQQMGWDAARINVNGGAIAIGHPIGASGARILVTLLHEMRRRRAVRGLASLCIDGGMGIALAVER
jgi:acetyl-CoA C-acetyltransferase